MCALSFGQRVFITDPSHQVTEASDPGPGFFCICGHQIEGLHVVSMIHGETAGRVEAAVGMTMENVWLTALSHFVQWVNGDWRSGVEKKNTILIIRHHNILIKDFCIYLLNYQFNYEAIILKAENCNEFILFTDQTLFQLYQ